MNKKTETSGQELCEKCKTLIGGNRYTPKHEDLVQADFKPFNSNYGAVDEYYYKCKNCGKEWLHERGSYGQGWV